MPSAQWVYCLDTCCPDVQSYLFMFQIQSKTGNCFDWGVFGATTKANPHFLSVRGCRDWSCCNTFAQHWMLQQCLAVSVDSPPMLSSVVAGFRKSNLLVAGLWCSLRKSWSEERIGSLSRNCWVHGRHLVTSVKPNLPHPSSPHFVSLLGAGMPKGWTNPAPNSVRDFLSIYSMNGWTLSRRQDQSGGSRKIKKGLVLWNRGTSLQDYLTVQRLPWIGTWPTPVGPSTYGPFYK